MASPLVTEFGDSDAYVVAKGAGLVTQVAVSILNYKNAQAAIACVQSLLRASEAVSPACRVKVLVADNASGADEQFQLQQIFSDMDDVHLQLNADNLGFAAGHNRNLAMIFERYSPDYVWLLNNDSVVDEDSLTALLKSAQQQPEVGIWGVTLIEGDGETIQCAGGCFYNAWVSSYRQYGQGKHRSQLGSLKTVNYDYIAGASMFFPVTALREGLLPAPSLQPAAKAARDQWLNETFFLYFEELDLARRLHPGLKMAWCREALVIHSGGKKLNVVNKRRSAWVEYHATLSALKFTCLYHPRRLWFTIPARYLSKCVQLLIRGKVHLFGPLTRAYRDYWSS